MGMKKRNLGLMMAMMMATNFGSDPFEEEEIQKEKKPPKKIIPKGLKEFFYGENSVFALNQKNADKKARKKGYI